MTTIPNNIIEAAKVAEQKTRVPASVTIAQWALESGWGAHAPGNNPFGIKAVAGHPKQTLMTIEFIKGHEVHEPQEFAVFPSIGDAFIYHGNLLSTKPAYAPAMAALPDVTKFIDLMAPRYATDPLYASKIKSVIKAHGLLQYGVYK